MSTKKTMSSDEWKQKADVLRQQLRAANREANKAKRLEQAAAAERQRQADIQYALAFVDFAKKLYVNDSKTTYYDVLSRKMAEQQQG